MAKIFDKVDMTTSLTVKENANGQLYVDAVAHAALTALTTYKVILNENGYVTAAAADDVTNYYFAVPLKAVASGDVGQMIIGGKVEDIVTPSLTMTAGHAFKVVDGAITDTGADFTGADGEFGIATATDSAAATTHDMVLCGYRIKGTT